MIKPLHIAMLIDAWFPFYGGGQVHVANLSLALTKYHHCQVKIFYPSSSHLVFRLLWSLYVIPQVVVYSLTHPIDIIHSHGYIPGLSSKILSLILNKPCVHTVHGSSLLDQQATGLKALMEKYLLTKIRYSAQITVSGNFLTHSNVNTNLHIIPNGVDLKNFDKIKSPQNKSPTLIWVGRRQDPVKGFTYLQQALLEIKQAIPHLKVEIVSGGRLHGQQLIKAYKRSHVFALPSLSEGQPITLLEAWAAKLPVVVTRVGDNPNMVQDNINGFLVPPKSPRQLSEKIIYLLTHRPQAALMGLAGYRLVSQHYTWDKVAGKTYQIYQTLLK